MKRYFAIEEHLLWSTYEKVCHFNGRLLTVHCNISDIMSVIDQRFHNLFYIQCYIQEETSHLI